VLPVAFRAVASDPGGEARPGSGRAFPALVVAALIIAAAVLRAGALGPSSLWLDDAWVALVTRAGGPGDVVLVGLTAPGFTALLWAWLGLAGLSSTAAQALPFLFAVLGPAALWLVLVRLGVRPVVATVAALILVTAPAHVTYATRVKQYSLDTLLAVVLLGLAWWTLGSPGSVRRWSALVGAAVGATVMSAAVVPVVAGGFAAAGLAAVLAGASGASTGRPGGWRWGDRLDRPARSQRREWRVALVGGGVYGVFALAWYWSILRPAVGGELQDYWAGHYLAIGDGPAAALRSLGGVLEGLFAAASPLPPVLTGALVLAGLGWLVARRPLVAVAVATPVLVAVVLAAAEAAPLGGGRTDHHLFPVLAVAAAFALEPLARLRPEAALAGAAAVVLALGLTASGPEDYPQQDLRPLSAELDARLGPDDTVLLYPSALWAYALYTELPVDIVDEARAAVRWQPVVRDERVVVLGRHRDDPDRYRPEVEAAVSRNGAGGSVWLLATHIHPDYDTVEDALIEAGWSVAERWDRPGALLTRWDAEDG
jgi:hypothetical protein